MSRTLRIAIYTASSVFLFVLFSFWMFPYDALEKRIESEVWNNFHVKLDIKKIKFSLPFGLKFYELDIAYPEKDYLRIQTQKGSLQFHPLMMFSEKLGIDLNV